jgi:uncharacterized protein YuzE
MSRIRYSPSVDALAIHLREATVDDSEEIEPGIVLDYDKEGKVIGIEILDFAARIREDALEDSEQDGDSFVEALTAGSTAA